MSDQTLIAVTSRSFSRHPVLREETLARYPNARFNDDGKSLAGDELAEFLGGARKAITALETIDDVLLAKLPDLELISKVGVGLDMLDQEAMERHGVALSFAKGTNSRSVSELVIGLSIALLRHVPEAANDMRQGGFTQRKGGTLSGRTVGIVGFGSVGRDLAMLVGAFGCRVLAHDVAPEVESVPLEELLRESDIVSLHLNLDESTRGLIGAEQLALMKPTAILLNTARGGLVDEAALLEALQEEQIAAAALDVWEVEPPEGSGLLELPSFIGTPHVGGSTEEAILAMGRAAIEGLDP